MDRMSGLESFWCIFICLVGVSRVACITEDGITLTGDNVCSYQKLSMSCSPRNISYSCWQHNSFRCQPPPHPVGTPLEAESGEELDDDSQEAAGPEESSGSGGRLTPIFSPLTLNRGNFSSLLSNIGGDSSESESTEDDDSTRFNVRICMQGQCTCYRSNVNQCSRVGQQCSSRLSRFDRCCNGYEEESLSPTLGQCSESVMCNENNGGCDHVCHTSDSGYQYCACYPGYTLQGATECVDIDECSVSGLAQCSHGCLNTQGGYTCTCPNGYELTTCNITNAYVCQEIDECADGNGGCEQQCTNTDGAFYCTCQTGFKLIHGFRCADVDECIEENGGCDDDCLNTPGGHCCVTAEGVNIMDETICYEAMEASAGAYSSFDLRLLQLVLPVLGIMVALVVVIIIIRKAMCCSKSLDVEQPKPVFAASNALYGHPEEKPPPYNAQDGGAVFNVFACPTYDTLAFEHSEEDLPVKQPIEENIYDNAAR